MTEIVSGRRELTELVTDHVFAHEHRRELLAVMDLEGEANELRFSQKRIAKDVLKCLQSAIDNAENNHSLDVDGLVVAQAHVGKNIVMRRMHARARGRGVHIQKFFSQITIVLRDTTKQPEAA